MKSSELRLGNFISVEHPSMNDGWYEMEVKSIDDENIGTDSYGVIYGTCDASISGCRGIPLTEEWLVKNGAIFLGRTESSSGYNFKDMIVQYWFTDQYCIVDLGQIDVTIKYVHQLQNLYFALTGEELTIK